MKITKRQFKRIIKEALKEMMPPDEEDIYDAYATASGSVKREDVHETYEIMKSVIEGLNRAYGGRAKYNPRNPKWQKFGNGMKAIKAKFDSMDTSDEEELKEYLFFELPKELNKLFSTIETTQKVVAGME